MKLIIVQQDVSCDHHYNSYLNRNEKWELLVEELAARSLTAGLQTIVFTVTLPSYASELHLLRLTQQTRCAAFSLLLCFPLSTWTRWEVKTCESLSPLRPKTIISEHEMLKPFLKERFNFIHKICCRTGLMGRLFKMVDDEAKCEGGREQENINEKQKKNKLFLVNSLTKQS